MARREKFKFLSQNIAATLSRRLSYHVLIRHVEVRLVIAPRTMDIPRHSNHASSGHTICQTNDIMVFVPSGASAIEPASSWRSGDHILGAFLDQLERICIRLNRLRKC
jgi:hypothetical protein